MQLFLNIEIRNNQWLFLSIMTISVAELIQGRPLGVHVEAFQHIPLTKGGL